MSGRLTQEQALVITGFTGVTCCKFRDFHADVERRLGRPVFTHEFGSEHLSDELREAYRADFMAMLSPEPPND